MVTYMCLHFVLIKLVSVMANYVKPVAAVLIPNIGGFCIGQLTKDQTRLSKTGQLTWYQVRYMYLTFDLL